jgi:hypothetical protein
MEFLLPSQNFQFVIHTSSHIQITPKISSRKQIFPKQ